jgi:hypothetical protein
MRRARCSTSLTVLGLDNCGRTALKTSSAAARSFIRDLICHPFDLALLVLLLLLPVDAVAATVAAAFPTIREQIAAWYQTVRVTPP